ncbi:MAG: hypothetical protein ACRCXE_00790 [Metamycoplasmataceae bacterium]
MINKKMKMIAATVLTGSVFAGVGLGFVMSYVQSLQTNLTVKFKNSIAISNFIGNIGNKDFITTADFDKSMKLMNGETEITNYSNLTVNEAYIKNYFKFEVPSKVKFYTDKEGIDVYIKNYNENTNDQNFDIYPSNYNSSSVEFKIWFGKGEGKDRVEDYIIIYGAGLNGFKKTQEELDVRSVVNLFQDSISLKKDFYKNFPSDRIIKDGVFAKSIEPDDIVSDLTIEQLKGVHWNVTSVEQDSKVPSKLNVNIDFQKGRQNENFFSQTFIQFEINDFPIEMGVDDYESKVKNFIKDEKNRRNLGEAFKYKRPEEQPEGTVGTVLENYRNGAFTFDLPFSFKNTASNAGVEYIFKPWEEGSVEYSAFPDEDDSEVPKFKIFIRSGSDTPFEYEEFFTIRGQGQVTNTPFDKTEINDVMDQLKELSNSSENPFTNESVILKLINEFADYNDRKNITANIIAGVNDPLDNIEISLGNLNLPGTIVIPTGLSLEVSAKKIEIIRDQLRVQVEISLGTEFEDKGSLLMNISYPGFESEIQYNQNLIKRFKDEINKDINLVTINTKTPITIDNTNAVKESIRLGNGDFYFRQDIFVGFDEIMNDFRWSSKPTFKIDFRKTVVEGDNIIFNVTINAGIENQTIEITRAISSFYN